MKSIKIASFFSIFIALNIMLISCDRRAKQVEAERLYIAAVDAYTGEQFTDSLELVRLAIKLDRNLYQASFLEGRILFFLDQIEEAEKKFSILVKKYPGFTEARIWYIRCLVLKNDFTTAQKYLDEELSFNQTDWRVYNLYSLLAQRTDNFEERIAMNRRAENILTTSASVYIDMAVTWYTLGLNDRAQFYLEKAQNILGTNYSLQELENVINRLLQEQ